MKEGTVNRDAFRAYFISTFRNHHIAFVPAQQRDVVHARHPRHFTINSIP